MGLIGDYDQDSTVSGLDKVIGTDYVTGKTKNYVLQDLFDSITTSASSIFHTRVITVEEELGKDFVQVINESLTSFTIQTGEVAFFIINDLNSDYLATYVMIRPIVTTAVTYGFSETQVTSGDFLLLQDVPAVTGEANTISSAGGTYVLAGTKNGVDLPVKGLSAGSGISMADDGSKITVTCDITQAEINTLGTIGSGYTLVATKSGLELRIKTISVTGANVTETSDDLAIHIWGRDTKTTDFTLDSTYDKKTIWINNGLNDVDITLPLGLSADFAVAVIQLGTGNVTFVKSGTLINGLEYLIEGENKQVWLERSPVGAETYSLLGNTKA